MIFANTKHKCEEIWQYLAADGHRIGMLTGDIPQKKRLSLLDNFTKGNLDILVVTDVAARGLHIQMLRMCLIMIYLMIKRITFIVLVERVGQGERPFN